MSSTIQCLCGDKIEDGITCPNCERAPEEQQAEYHPETSPENVQGDIPTPKPHKTGNSRRRRTGTTASGNAVKSAWRRSDRGDGNAPRDLGFSNYD